MTAQESARALLKIAYDYLHPQTGTLDMDKFWKKAQEAGIRVFSNVNNKRNQVSGLVKALEYDAAVESLAALKAEIPNRDRESFNTMLADLAEEGRLPIKVEHARRTTDLKDKRLAIGALDG